MRLCLVGVVVLLAGVVRAVPGAPTKKALKSQAPATSAATSIPTPVPTPAPVPTPTPQGLQLVLQGGGKSYGYGYSHVTVARNGRWVASDNFTQPGIGIWDGENALFWGTWPRENGATPLRFTPDATRLLTSQSQYSMFMPRQRVTMCEVPSGRRLFNLDLSNGPLWCDDERVRSVSNGVITEFDAHTGQQLTKRRLQDISTRQRRFGVPSAFSRNGEFLVAGTQGALCWWRTSDGKCLGYIADRARAVGKAAISNDGHWLASESGNFGVAHPLGGGRYSSQLHIWNATNGKLMRTLPGYQGFDTGSGYAMKPPNPLYLLEFSADGNILFTPDNSFSDEAPSRGLNRYAWRERSPLLSSSPLSVSLLSPVALSDDGENVVAFTQSTSSDGSYLRVCNSRTLEPRIAFPSELRALNPGVWSPDGHFFVSGRNGNRLTLWDARSGMALARRERGERNLDSSDQLRWVDNKTLLSLNVLGAQWLEIPTLAKQREFVAPTLPDDNPAQHNGSRTIFSPDAKLALTGFPLSRESSEVWLSNVAAQTVVRKIPLRIPGLDNRNFSSMLWVPGDIPRVVLGTPTGMVLLNAATGTLEREWKDPDDATFSTNEGSSALLPLAVSGDGKWLVVRPYRGDAQKPFVYDLTTGVLVRRLPVGCGYQAQFLKDHHTVVLTTPTGIEWWDVTTNHQTAQEVLNLGNSIGTEWTLSPDEKQISLGSTTGRSGVGIWNIARHKEVLRLYTLEPVDHDTAPDWIALTPEGFYDASPGGEKRLRWRDPSGFWPLTRSRAAFRNSTRVAQALQEH